MDDIPTRPEELELLRRRTNTDAFHRRLYWILRRLPRPPSTLRRNGIRNNVAAPLNGGDSAARPQRAHRREREDTSTSDGLRLRTIIEKVILRYRPYVDLVKEHTEITSPREPRQPDPAQLESGHPEPDGRVATVTSAQDVRAAVSQKRKEQVKWLKFRQVMHAKDFPTEDVTGLPEVQRKFESWRTNIEAMIGSMFQLGGGVTIVWWASIHGPTWGVVVFGGIVIAASVFLLYISFRRLQKIIQGYLHRQGQDDPIPLRSMHRSAGLF